MTTYGLLIFDNAEELDFIGPREVFAASALYRDNVDTVVTIAERLDLIRAEKGMLVLPDHTFDDHPPLDVLLVPSGSSARQNDPTLIEWVNRTAPSVDWVTSVCTGAFLLHDAGLMRNKRVATHRSYEDELAARGDVTVVRDARYVVDGNLITSQGMSAGIDMALWLVGHLHGREHVLDVFRYLQYEPAPPYRADVPAHIAAR